MDAIGFDHFGTFIISIYEYRYIIMYLSLMRFRSGSLYSSFKFTLSFRRILYKVDIGCVHRAENFLITSLNGMVYRGYEKG